jgi:type IV pilus assembly protein PilW
VDENPPHVFVTVGAYVHAPDTSIPLDQTPDLAAPNSPIRAPGRLFHEQTNPGFTHSCFSKAQPHVLLINRAAFFVAMYDDDGKPNTPERTPYLMLHQGLDMPDANTLEGDGLIDINDAVPVAEGIEQLQVAYVLDTHFKDPDKTPIILGVNAPMPPDHYGENWEQSEPTLTHGWFFKPMDSTALDQNRLKDHPANIRQVRMTVVTRSSLSDPQIIGDDLLLKPDGNPYPDGPAVINGTIPWRHLENLTTGPVAPEFAPVGGHYYRAIQRESITPKNLLLNRQFAPINPGGG